MQVRHLVTYLLPNIAMAVSSFGTVAVLTRLLSEAEYGRYALVYTAMSLGQYLALTWIEAAAARYYSEAQARGEKPDHFKTLLTLYGWCAGGFGLLTALLVLLVPLEPGVKIALVAAFAGVIVRSCIKIALETRRMALEATRYALVDSFHTLTGFVLSVGFVAWFGMAEEGAYIGLLVASVMVLAIEGPALWAARKAGRFQPERAKAYIAFGAPAAFSLIMTLAMTSADRFLIAGYLSEADVGAYSAGYQVGARMLDIIAMWASAAVFPLVARAYDNEGPLAAARAARAGFAVRFGIGAPAALGIALVAQPLCDLLIGEALRDQAAHIARWIAIAALLACLCEYFAEAFVLAKKALQRALLMAVPVAANVGLNMLLLPVMGLDGAIVATITSYAVGLVLLAAIGRRYVPLPVPLVDVGKIALACAFMAAVVLSLPAWGGIAELAAKALMVGLAYTVMALLLDIADARSRLEMIHARLTGRNQPEGSSS
jgi:O-antigen/teichoic acid export membrane protein